MNTLVLTDQAIRQEVVKVISSYKKLPPQQVSAVNDLIKLDFDILDVVEVILKLERKYKLTIPDDVPVYSVDDFVNFISTHNIKQAE